MLLLHHLLLSSGAMTAYPPRRRGQVPFLLTVLVCALLGGAVFAGLVLLGAALLR